MEELVLKPGGYSYDNRYVVIGGLGSGNCSKVYIAQDNDRSAKCHSQLVALKVLYQDPDGIVSLEERIARGELPELLKDSGDRLLLPTRLIEFQVPHDPRSSYHTALVMTTLAGPSIFEYAKTCDFSRLPVNMALVAMTDAVSSLAYLHRHNIGHGDFHNRNLLLLPSSPMSRWPTNKLEAYTARRPFGIHASKLESAHMEDMMSFFAENDMRFDGRVLLTDFGSSYEGQGPEWLTGDARFVINAPERLEERAWGLPSDIWSLGCTIIEVLAGIEIFRPNSLRYPGPTDFGDTEVKQRIYELLPPWRWEPNELKSEMKSLWPPALSTVICRQLEDLLEKMLVLEPERRLKIHEVAETWRTIGIC